MQSAQLERKGAGGGVICEKKLKKKKDLSREGHCGKQEADENVFDWGWGHVPVPLTSKAWQLQIYGLALELRI